MKLTGNADFQLHQAVNFKIEILTALPAHSASYEGRMVYITTAGVNQGYNFATAVGWVNLSASVGSPTPIEFKYLNGIGAGVTVNLWRGCTKDYFITYCTGSIIGIHTSLSEDCTAGQCDFTPTVNGSPIATPGLVTTITTTNPNDRYAFVAPSTPGALFATDDKIGIQAVSSAAWRTNSPLNTENVSGILFFVCV